LPIWHLPTASLGIMSAAAASLGLKDVRDVPLRQAPSLAASAVDLAKVLAAARESLFAIVDACPGDKCLVLDPAVAGPLKLVLVEGSNALRQVRPSWPIWQEARQTKMVANPAEGQGLGDRWRGCGFLSVTEA
jgi:hypothetical protein